MLLLVYQHVLLEVNKQQHVVVGLPTCVVGGKPTPSKVIDPTTQDGWDTHLDPIMAACRASKHESTGMTPYFMLVSYVVTRMWTRYI